METRAHETVLPEPEGRALVGSYATAGETGVRWLTASPDGLAVGSQGLALPNASWLEWLDERRVLAVSEGPQSELALLVVDGESITLASSQPTHGADACHLAISPDGAWVAVANYSSGQLTLFRAPAGDELESAVDVLQCEGSGPVAERQESSHCHQVTWLDGRHLLVCDLGADRVWVVRVEDDAKLAQLGAIALPAGFGPRHLVLREDADGTRLFVLCGELSGQLAVVRHEGADFGSGWVIVDLAAGSASVAEGGHLANQPSGLVWFGDDLVLANRGCNTVARFSWADQGQLTLASESPCGGEHPRDLVEHAGHLWVANQHSDVVVVLRAVEEGFAEIGRAHVTRPARLLFG